MNTFQIRGLDPAPFAHLYGLDDATLAAAGVRRYLVDENPGFPDRVELRDLDPGETALLLNYEHQPENSPYRASHAIYIREGATEAYASIGEIPAPMLRRMLSLRAFDNDGMMIAAELAEGDAVAPQIASMLSHADVAYIHAHYAKRGCFAARIDRLTAVNERGA